MRGTIAAAASAVSNCGARSSGRLDALLKLANSARVFDGAAELPERLDEDDSPLLSSRRAAVDRVSKCMERRKHRRSSLS